ncbi:MAG: hypothetical protein KDJ52_25575 [Anaerolineae bacterium]|nr:hypothetical protein [Anaerolineae bacterium]
MDDTTIFEEIAEAGYLLLDPPHPASPGGLRLMIALRETPTEEHYDPERIDLFRAEPDGTVLQTHLTLKTFTNGSWPLCAGTVVLRDRFDKRVYFFTYGGRLDIYSDNGMAVCDLHSTAPIVTMSTDSQSVTEQLAVETEALLARIHATWGRDDSGYYHRLAEIDPLALYGASIMYITENYEENSALRHCFHSFYEMLIQEHEWLHTLGRPDILSTQLNVLLTPANPPAHSLNV